MAIELDPIRQELQNFRQGLNTATKRRLKEAAVLAVDRLEEMGVLDWFGEEVKARLPKVINVRGITPQFTSRFINLTGDGFVPLMYAGHFVHLDVLIMSEAFSELRTLAVQNNLAENLSCAVLTLAKSAINGKQDRFMQVMFPKLEDFARQRQVEFIKVVRPKDVDLYDMERKPISQNRPLISRLRQRGTAAIIFPYGSIQAGRHPEDGKEGEIYGLKKLVEPNGEPKRDLLDMYNAMESSGRRIGQRPYLLPVGLSRTYKLQNPDSYLPSPEGIISIYDRLSTILGLLGFRRIVSDANIGEPLDLENKLGSEWRKNPEEVNTLSMEEVAKLLQPSERGEYSYVKTEEELSLAA